MSIHDIVPLNKGNCWAKRSKFELLEMPIARQSPKSLVMEYWNPIKETSKVLVMDTIVSLNEQCG